MSVITREGCYPVGYMIPDGYRKPKEPAMPEYTSACYKDTGCHLHSRCLTCPEELPGRCPLEKNGTPHKPGNEHSEDLKDGRTVRAMIRVAKRQEAALQKRKAIWNLYQDGKSLEEIAVLYETNRKYIIELLRRARLENQST